MNNIKRKNLIYINESLKNDVIEILINLRDDIENIANDEEFSFDNLPDGLKDSDRGQNMQDSIDELNDQVSNIDDIIDEINAVIENINDIVLK